MVVKLEEIAKLLQINKDNLLHKGLMAYLKERLRELRTEINVIHLKYHISSLEDFDIKINRGEFSETDTFEDFARLDYLESEEEKFNDILGKLSHDL